MSLISIIEQYSSDRIRKHFAQVILNHKDTGFDSYRTAIPLKLRDHKKHINFRKYRDGGRDRLLSLN